MNESLDFEIELPQSFYLEESPSYKQEEQPKTETPGLRLPENLQLSSTTGSQDARFRKGTLTDPTERLIAGVD